MLRRSTPYRPYSVDPPDEGRPLPRQNREDDRHTLGSIIWYAMIRVTITIFASIYLRDQFGFSEWWLVTIAAAYGIGVYPAQIQYGIFKRASRHLQEQTLCSSCLFFNADGLHCTRLDEHVSEHYLPCEGEGWQPRSFEDV